ncbi:ATP-binding protein [Brevibacillus migulae]|uniref:ATP-binding protein n=1 Tax=Brevibacillus migulae TaxID=1644114 RepID=UPI00106E4A6C|nr:sensor histidine kinase [Brevibacillus migulae]
MSLAKQMILQIFFTLIPMVVFSIYYRDKLRNYSKRFIFVTSSICLLLSMTFAASVVDGLIFDIRYVILFFGLVYGGLQTGILLMIEFALYRAYIGGQGAWVAMLIQAIVFSLSLYISKLYNASYRKNMVTFFASIVFSLIPLTLTYYFFPSYVMEHLTFHIIFIPVQTSLGIWLLMTLFSKSVADKEIYIRHVQNEKVKTMSHVAASLAHEVRNPLTAVKGFLKLIQEDKQDLVKLEQYIDICLDEVQRTESILSEYLSISKPLTQKHEPLDLSAQLISIRDVMSPFANMHNVLLQVQTPNIPVMIWANPDEIKQVLVNFVKNAIEACADVQHGAVLLKLVKKENEAVLVIKDNGVGMNAEQINRLGSIYFSTKSSGTGLGLTYSYQVIHAIGGTVSVYSKPQMGTVFTITFPGMAEKEAGSSW